MRDHGPLLRHYQEESTLRSRDHLPGKELCMDRGTEGGGQRRPGSS